jgi:hypothetical protein
MLSINILQNISRTVVAVNFVLVLQTHFRDQSTYLYSYFIREIMFFVSLTKLQFVLQISMILQIQ